MTLLREKREGKWHTLFDLCSCRSKNVMKKMKMEGKNPS